MVVPRRHVADLDGLTAEELAGVFELVRSSSNKLRKAVRPDALNIGINLGKVAGAGAEDHLHVHIVPRWSGDHNFMPVMSSTMVMPEMLASTYKRLLPYFSGKK